MLLQNEIKFVNLLEYFKPKMIILYENIKEYILKNVMIIICSVILTNLGDKIANLTF